jgi:hypothetical protein
MNLHTLKPVFALWGFAGVCAPGVVFGYAVVFATLRKTVAVTIVAKKIFIDKVIFYI